MFYYKKKPVNFMNYYKFTHVFFCNIKQFFKQSKFPLQKIDIY